MVTAYDYPSAMHVDRAGIDVVLVGDSCAMVELGFETTLVSAVVVGGFGGGAVRCGAVRCAASFVVVVGRCPARFRYARRFWASRRLVFFSLLSSRLVALFRQPITLDEMIYHCQAVKRGAPNRPLLVGDMPFGSYEYRDVDIALRNAYRMVKEGGMDAVKFEGGTEARSGIVRHVVQGGSEYL
jgi:ketopantoate hydroxymethyltransferase